MKAKTGAKLKPLKITITNLGSDKAPVLLGLYGTENEFLNEKDTLKNYMFKPAGKNVITAEINDLEYGQYAFALFQDMDNDGKISRNFLGIPKDPYGFSNSFKPRLKAPSFNDCCFDYSEDQTTQEIEMIR